MSSPAVVTDAPPQAGATAAPVQVYTIQTIINNNSTNNESGKGGGGLSKGEIAGIVIGAISGVLTLVGTIAAVMHCCT